MLRNYKSIIRLLLNKVIFFISVLLVNSGCYSIKHQMTRSNVLDDNPYSSNIYEQDYDNSKSKKRFSVSSIDSYSPEIIRSSAAIHKATMRTYKIAGTQYHPKIPVIGQSFKGIASWYGPKFHGKKTSNGEIYNMHAMTAAHKTFPMNTIVRVKATGTNKSIVVRINDRGPFIEGRIIDLSFQAGKKLGLDTLGTRPVKVTVLSLDKYAKMDFLGELNKTSKVTRKTKKQNYALQLASFRSKKSAQKVAKQLSKIYKNITVKDYKRKHQIFYKILIVGFKNKAQAIAFKNKKSLKNALIIMV